MSESLFDSLIDIIHNALDNNPEINKGPQDQLLEIEENNPTELFANCAQIVNTDDDPRIDSNVYNMALILLTRLLDYNKRGSVLADFWTNLDDPIKSSVRTAAIRSILFEASETANIGAVFFARLFNVDYEIFEVGDYLYDFLTNQNQFNDFHRLSALKALAQLVDPNNVVHDDDHINKLNEIVHRIASECLIHFFESLSQFSIEFSLELLSTISTLFLNIPPTHNESKEFIQRLFITLPDLFSICEDNQIFESLYRMLYSIIISTYDIDDYYTNNIITVESIVSFGENGLSCSDDFLQSTLKFWIELLTWEKDRFDLNVKNEKFCKAYEENIKSQPTFLKLPQPLPYRGIGNLAVERITKHIIQLAATIDEKSTDPEDPEFPENCMYACNILERLFNFNPQIVFDEVKDFWDSTKDAEEWTLQHARCIIPHIFCKNQFITIPGLRDFVLSTTNYIIPFLTNHDTVLRIVESGFYTLYLIEKRYENVRSKEIFEQIINAINTQQSRHRTIAKRCLEVIKEIIIKSKSVDKAFHSQIEEPVFNIIGDILSVDEYAEDEELIRICYLTLFQYIKESSEYCFDSMQNRIIQIIKDISTLSSQSLDDLPSPSLYHTLIQTKLWLLSGIFRRFKDRLPDQSIGVAKTLFQIMEYPTTENLREEILTCLFDIILAVPKENEDVKNKIIEYVQRSFESGDPSLATTAINALSFIFERYQENANDKLNDALTSIFNILDDDTFPADYKPRILFSLARILKSVSKKLTSELRQNLFEQIDKYISFDFDLRSVEDVKFFNDVYASAYMCFGSILSGMHTEDINFINFRNFFKNLIKPLNRLAKVTPIINNTIWCICMFLENALPVFGRKGNIFLNYHCNYFICIWGTLEDEDPSLQRYSKEILKKIKES